jgi:hypothetical protein
MEDEQGKQGNSEGKEGKSRSLLDDGAESGSVTKKSRSDSVSFAANTPAGAVKQYLAVGASIDTVTLPMLTNEGYPAFVLDAASGTGKTQQAFCFLAKGEEMVYMLCSESKWDNQLIYSGMFNEVPTMQYLLQLFKKYAVSLGEDDMAIEHLKECLVIVDSCDFSTNTIEAFHQKMKEEGDKGAIAVEALTRMLYSCLIEQSSDKKSIVMLTGSSHRTATFETIKAKLKDKIVFVDEAIPSGQSSDGKERELVLRLIRNLVRVLGMRAVMAGTASCLTNMMLLSDFSRTSLNPMTCIECGLFWLPMSKLPDFNVDHWEASMDSTLKKHRPLFLLAIRDFELRFPDSSLASLLISVGDHMQSSKSISLSSKFHWFSGAWLDGDRKVPSAFNTMAPSLVKGHFFEPAVTVVSQNNNKPYLGVGITSVGRLTGPRTATIGRCCIGDKAWWSISNDTAERVGKQSEDKMQTNTSLTTEFSEIL